MTGCVEFVIKMRPVLLAQKIHHSQTAIDVNVKITEKLSHSPVQNAQHSTHYN